MKEINNSTKNMEDVREKNLSLVIKLLHKLKICSRAEIAEISGLKQSTITNIIKILIEGGLVYETGSIDGKKGRRSIGISLKNDLFWVIGIRLTRTSFSVGYFDINGSCYKSKCKDFSTECLVEDILFDIENEVSELINKSTKKIIAIGLSVPGPFLAKDSRFLLVTGVIGWEKVNFTNFFTNKFDIPFYIEHDANAGVLAEWWYGKNNLEHGVYIYVALGYGIGAGIINNGKIFHGAMGIAGEIGHMSINCNGPRCKCGNNGCLEMFSSTHAIVEYVQKNIQEGKTSTLKENADFNSIVDAYHAGDALAIEAITRSAEVLGIGIVNLINTYNPDIIILGDNLIKAGEKFLFIVRETVRKHTLPELYEGTQINYTSFDYDPAFIGAGALAIDMCLREPSKILSVE